MSFENKVVLITGSGSGIGEAAAILFAKEGADVVIDDKNEQDVNKTAEQCKQFGERLIVIKADISKDDEGKKAVEKSIAEYGKLDVLINNAGRAISGNLRSGNIMETFDEDIGTNLRTVVLMTSLAFPHLAKTKGCIVNISSVITSPVKFGPLLPTYAMARASVDLFTRISAKELAPAGIRVNIINPEPVFTNEITETNLPIAMDGRVQVTALKNSEPQKFADVILFLSSDKAKGITGTSFCVDNEVNIM